MGIEANGVRALADKFGRVPDELRSELRPKIRQAGQALTGDIKSNASWSSRIPGAVRMTTSFASKTGGVRIFVDSGRARHARPYENMGQQGSFRHPVFGGPAWVSQEARPFFFPAVKANVGNVRKLIEEAVRASFPK